MDAGFYAGRRLSYDGHLCTVRYHGPLAGTTGAWLGVEWDDASRGKHDGKYKGEQIFQCDSLSSTAASFIRPNRKPDQERTVLEAIKYKYDTDPTDATSDVDVVVISGKVAEEVGFDKIAREQSQLAELRVVLVDQFVVNGITPRGSAPDSLPDAQNELSAMCPNITELDLGWNTIEHWSQAAEICAALPKLTTLRLGGLRFASFRTSSASSPLAQIKELHLEECLLTADEICDMFKDSSDFSSLQELYLSGNGLSTLEPTNKRPLPCIRNVRSVVLENNHFTDLECLASITRLFPQVKALSLQGNHISMIGQKSSPTGCTYPQIEALNISHNRIDSYACIDSLPQLLPSLSSLRITNNPLFDQSEQAAAKDPRASDKSFYLTLARVPTLTTLNHAKINARERQEGEIYYLSIAEKELGAVFSANKDKNKAEIIAEAKSLHPQYQPLTLKYDRPSIIEQFLNPLEVNGKASTDAFKAPEQIYPPGSLGARLVTATFYITTRGTENTAAEITLRLPSSLPATRVMSILLQHPAFQADLRPLQFNLVYESTELDPVDTTAESTTKSAIYGKKLTAEEKRSLWKGFGDWDADAIVDDALQQQADLANGDVQDQGGAKAMDEHWTEDGAFLIREGRKWKRREIVIPHALKRPWGDWIEDAKEVRIRIEPFERTPWGK
ncbi:hypothetical protein PMZ80_001326 [Knufia obscura]|uniref:CAP-Gly domain-containing protein n=1 Tax=Knufia obscura TaxID=1635080 RepID=A0ABR0S3X2_9EURO|nr:hypothetical protein PMZ80_001326 [Knufia obscura]